MWKDAHDMVKIFASDAEETEFNRLFGLPENHRGLKKQVAVNGHDVEGQPLELGGPNVRDMPNTQARSEVGLRDENNTTASWIPVAITPFALLLQYLFFV